MKKFLCCLFLLSFLSCVSWTQTTTLTVNNSTGQINVPAGLTPYFDVLNVAGVPVPLLVTPQKYGAIADGSTHPLSGSFASLALAQAAYSFSIPACTTSNGSPNVTVGDGRTLRAGFPISGPGIPAGTTITTITDANNFVMSANATASAGVLLTSSFVTDLTQEIDWAACQMAAFTSGSFYMPTGVYIFGSSTLRTTTAVPVGGENDVAGDGNSISGAGPQLTKIISTGDAIHILGRYQSLRDMSIQGPGSAASGTRTSAIGVQLGEGGYANGFHLSHVNVYGFASGYSNPQGWDAGSVENCYLSDNFNGAFTSGNQDRLRFTGTTIVSGPNGFFSLAATLTNGSPNVTVASTDCITPGATVTGTNIPADTRVASVTDSTHFVLSQNATGSGAVTAAVSTVGLRVDGSGSAEWNGGVSAGNGVTLAMTNGGGAVLANLHAEGSSGTYITAQDNAGIALYNVYFTDGGTSIDAGASPTIGVEKSGANNGTHGKVVVKSRGGTVTSNDSSATWLRYGDHWQLALPWVTVGSGDVPGVAPWPPADAYHENQFVSQVSDSGSSTPSKLWQCARTSGSTWAYVVRNASGAGLTADTDGTLAANSDSNVATQKAVKTYVDGKTIGVANGGTNVTSYTAGDLLYATGSTTLTKLAKGSDGQVLTMDSGTHLPVWAASTGTITTYSASGTFNTPSGTTMTNMTAITLPSVAVGTYQVHIRGVIAFGAGDGGWKWDLKGGTAVFSSNIARYNGLTNIYSLVNSFVVNAVLAENGTTIGGLTVNDGNIYNGESWSSVGNGTMLYDYVGTLNVTTAGSVIMRMAQAGAGNTGNIPMIVLELIKQ